MNVKEIEKYISVGARSSVCVYRKIVENLDLFVMSVSITGKLNHCIVCVEFDPIDMVDEGEGWVWHSETTDLFLIVKLLEEFAGLEIQKWENFTKSGRLQYFNGDIDMELYERQENLFKAGGCGEEYLPKGFIWKTKPIN